MTDYEMKCEGCGLGPEYVGGGRGMLLGLFESRTNYCGHCEELVGVEVPTSLADLRSALDGREHIHEEMPTTRDELLNLAIKLRTRFPDCPECHRPTKRLRRMPNEQRTTVPCPRCGEEKLKWTGNMIFGD